MTRVTILAALLLTGCSFSPSADVIKAMGEDPASVCVRMRATYMAASGDVLVARTNITSGTMKCNADGITVTPSDTTEVQVPQKNVTVTPKP